MIRFPLVIAMLSVSAFLQSGCLAGVFVGGAALGVASVQEGGISQSATDLRIKTHILNAWAKYDVKIFAKLNLRVDQGRVMLSGVVQNPEDRVEAVRLVWLVYGVQEVINEITVTNSEGVSGYLRDKWISTRLRSQLIVDADVLALNYSVETVQSVVYLMGVAQTESERETVIDYAREIPHVKRVVSYINLAGETTRQRESRVGKDDASQSPEPVAEVEDHGSKSFFKKKETFSEPSDDVIMNGKPVIFESSGASNDVSQDVSQGNMPLKNDSYPFNAPIQPIPNKASAVKKGIESEYLAPAP